MFQRALGKIVHLTPTTKREDFHPRKEMLPEPHKEQHKSVAIRGYLVYTEIVPVAHFVS